MVMDEVTEQPELVPLGPFVLPPPPPLTEEEAGNIGRGTVERIFDMVTSMDMPQKPTKGSNQQQLGFARLAASTFDRDAWVTLLTRLATRASASVESNPKPEYDLATGKNLVISTTIREMLYRYVVEDFRSRINVGISWMNEEWYNDQIQLRYAASIRGKSGDTFVPLHYDCWVLRLLDGFLPYLDARDKVLIRFVSEIPQLTVPVVERVKSLARDPERVNLSVQALLYVLILGHHVGQMNLPSIRYLVMFRPPARDMCLDALDDIYNTCEYITMSIFFRTPVSDRCNRRRIAFCGRQGTFQMATADSGPTTGSNKTGRSFTLDPSRKWHQISTPIRKCGGPGVANESCHPATTARSWSRSWLRHTRQKYILFDLSPSFFPRLACIIPTACFISKGVWEI